MSHHGSSYRASSSALPPRRIPQRRPVSTQSLLAHCEKNGKTEIRCENDAQDLIREVISHREPFEVLFRMKQKPNLMESVQQALSLDASVDFLIDSYVPFLDFLARDDFQAGEARKSHLNAVIQSICTSSLVLEFLKQALAVAVSSDLDLDIKTVAWFVLKVHAICQETSDDTSSIADRNKILREISVLLLDHPNCNNPERHSLQTIVAGASLSQAQLKKVKSRNEMRDSPGGRHDNDCECFRDIVVLPTKQEMQESNREPYLPLARDMTNLESDVQCAFVLDRQFRLLREDFIGPIREELSLIRKGLDAINTVEARRLKSRTFVSLRVNDILPELKDDKLKGVPGLRISFLHPLDVDRTFGKGSKSDAKDSKSAVATNKYRKFWEDHPRLLSQRSLVCFVLPNKELVLGSVCMREDSDLSAQHPSIGVRVDNETDLCRLLEFIGEKSMAKCQMIQLSASFFAVEPVLNQLKRMTDIPLGHSLVSPDAHLHAVAPLYDSWTLRDVVDLIRRSNDKTDLGKFFVGKPGTPSSLFLDESQREAVVTVMDHCVGLIQGPPGTGKSFCGALVGRLIYDYTDETILCVCYTNHALDQFLEDLLDRGVAEKDIVRLGSSSKMTDRIANLSLQRQKDQQVPRSKEENRVYGQAKDEMRELREEAKELFERLRALNLHSTIFWRDLVAGMEELSKGRDLDPLRTHKSDDFGVVIGKRGKAAADDDLFGKWVAGKPLPESYGHIRDRLKLWEMTKAERAKQLQDWTEEIVKDLVEQLACCLRAMRGIDARFRQMKTQSNIQTMLKKRIIGCTTTGAANYFSELASIGAGVLLVEEAGEILESHVLTSLSRNTKHVIMIGDHFQLRPKVNKYEMQVESRQGLDLNKSLFERLIVDHCYPHAMLQKQHRMRNEIADIVRHLTYPSLRDDASVLNRANVRGLLKNVVFVNHQQGEGDHESIKQRGEETGSSKTNTFEVGMVVATCKYLLQQGYNDEQMVVLTPYLGQLQKIRTALRTEFDVSLNDMDAQDLIRAGENIDQNGGSSNKRPKIYVATVDNYQGEEADIVVASLVRSNPAHSIGFLAEPERVNVLLSRARLGMILFGDMETLTNASNRKGAELWKKINNFLSNDSRQSVVRGLPVRCDRHPTQLSYLETVDDFKKCAPDGGCLLACTYVFETCGHKCGRKCHRLEGHESVKCTSDVRSTCEKGHPLHFKCHVGRPSICKICEKIQAAEEKRKKAEAEEQRKRDAEEVEHRMQKAEREAQLQKINTEMQTLEISERRRLEDERLRLETDIGECILRVARTSLPGQTDEKISSMKEKAEQRKAQALSAPIRNNEKPSRAQGTGNGRMTMASPKENAQSGARPRSSDMSTSNGMLLSTKPRNANDTADFLSFVIAFCGLPKENEILSFVTDWKFTELEDCPPFARGALSHTMKTVLEKCAQNEWRAALTKAGKMSQATVPNLQLFLMLCRSKLNDDSLRNDLDEKKEIVASCDQISGILDLVSSAVLLQRYDDNECVLRGAVCALAAKKLLTETAGPFFEHITGLPPTVIELFNKLCDDVLTVAKQQSTPSIDSSSQSGKSLSGAFERWSEAKAIKGAASVAIDKLMNLIGIETIKTQFLDMYDSILLDKSRSANGKPSVGRRSLILTGNPGTGKTTIARIYSEFLSEQGIFPGKAFEETTGARLVDDGVDGLKKAIAAVEKGGVLFIDEAYQLNPGQDRQGGKVLDLLLTEVENKRSTMAVVLAGYKGRMDKLLQFNEGLPTRFPTVFDISDFDDSELLAIAKGYLSKQQNGRYHVDDEKIMRILSRRVGYLRGREGFGNARAVENAIEKVLQRQSRRIISLRSKNEFPDEWFIAMSDVVGIDGPPVLDDIPAWRRLEAMEGLGEVKDAIRGLAREIAGNYVREQKEEKLADFFLNRVFLGSPGTGKTTVAKLFGEIVCSLGLLSKGDLIIKKPADFLGGALGVSEQQTKAILKAAEGCVLVIDEAYGLCPIAGGKNSNITGSTPDPYKVGVIDTIVAEVQNTASEDRCVVLCGYREEMEHLLRVSNPGLARRFPLEKAFYFADFTDDELLRILNNKVQQLGISVSTNAQRVAIEELKKLRCKPNFGNGGAVDNLLSKARENCAKRCKNMSVAESVNQSKVLLEEDFVAGAPPRRSLEAILAGLVGSDGIRTTMIAMKQTVDFWRDKGVDPISKLFLNFRFVGPPGTGKTTVARKMGEFFYTLDLLSSADVEEVTPKDLIGSFVGQTRPKTEAVMDRALGRVLFIDEAYGLHPSKSPYCTEALEQLLSMLTDPRYMGKMVVILAGYEKEIDELLETNPGLKSRFQEQILFKPLTEEQCVQLLDKKLQTVSFKMDAGAIAKAQEIFVELVKTPNWANGRDVETIAKKVEQHTISVSMSVDEDDDVTPVKSDHVSQPMLQFLQERRKRGSSSAHTELPSILPQAQQLQQQVSPPSLLSKFEIAKSTEVKSHDEDIKEETEKSRLNADVSPVAPSWLQDGLRGALLHLGMNRDDAVNRLMKEEADEEIAREVAKKTKRDVETVKKEMEAMQQEIARRVQKVAKVPVIRCLLCGRPNCPVRPAVVGYLEVILPA
eukprot:ANDGO_01319.mRNA.1 Protein cfxQ homolog